MPSTSGRLPLCRIATCPGDRSGARVFPSNWLGNRIPPPRLPLPMFHGAVPFPHERNGERDGVPAGRREPSSKEVVRVDIHRQSEVTLGSWSLVQPQSEIALQIGFAWRLDKHPPAVPTTHN